MIFCSQDVRILVYVACGRRVRSHKVLQKILVQSFTFDYTGANRSDQPNK